MNRLIAVEVDADKDGYSTSDPCDFYVEYVYTPFGDESYADTTYDNVSNRYTGQILDDETGLYYYNARYYDPEIARFVQADTVLPTTASQGLNRYSYCANNPLVYTDPSGHDPVTLTVVLATIATKAAIGAAIGAAVGAGVSAITGGNVGQGAMYGAIGGAMGGALSCFGAYLGNVMAGKAILVQNGLMTGLTGNAAGFCGAVAGAASGGALSAAITGGDPGLAAATAGISSGVGMGLGLGDAAVGTADWYGELAASTCLGAGIGGTVAEIRGGDFWQGVGQAAASSAAGFVISGALSEMKALYIRSVEKDNAWLVIHTDKAKYLFLVGTDFSMVTAIKAINIDGEIINYMEYTGHATSYSLLGGPDGLSTVNFDEHIELFRDTFAPDARIQLQGCHTAANGLRNGDTVPNICEKFFEVVPQGSVKGYTWYVIKAPAMTECIGPSHTYKSE